MSQKAEIPFLPQNLRNGEEILFTAKPPRRKRIALSFFKNTVIPFPFAWLWGVIDLSILLGVPIGMAGTEEAYVIAIIIPFIGVHATPFWIYLYNVIANIRDAKSHGYILTTERIFYRMERKKPFTFIELKQIETIQVTNTSKVSWLNIHLALKTTSSNTSENSFDITGLTKPDVEQIYAFLESFLAHARRRENKVKYQSKCLSCGGRTEDGYCLYCGTRAELRKEEDKKAAGSTSSSNSSSNSSSKSRSRLRTNSVRAQDDDLDNRIREIQENNKKTISELMSKKK